MNYFVSMRSIFALLAFAFLFTGLSAQTGKVRGKVSDQGKGLEGSEVTLYAGLKKVAELVTDETGAFDFGQVAAGCYDVEATIGTIRVTQNICLEENTSFILNMYDGPPCPCCPSRLQVVANPSWHGEIPRADLDLPRMN